MLSLPELAVLGFAVSRGVQLVVHDTIVDPLRDRLNDWHMNGIGPGRTNRARSFVQDLLSCVYCVGFWAAVASVVVYLTATGTWGAAPFLVHCIEAWAVAGIAMIINRVDDTLPVRG